MERVAKLLIILAILIVSNRYSYKTPEYPKIPEVLAKKYDPLYDPQVKTLDSIFRLEENIITQFQTNKFLISSPLQPQYFINAMWEVYQETCVVVPVELAISQVILESAAGTRGRSALNNPFNVGEWDNGTKISFSHPSDGIKAYYRLMANDYLQKRDMEDLLINFLNKNGHRYASDVNYERKLKVLISRYNI